MESLGPTPARREYQRSQLLRLRLRPGELADLVVLAEAWHVPPATAAWGVLAERLARWRHAAVQLGPLGFRVAAGLGTLGAENVQALLRVRLCERCRRQL